MIIPGLSLMAPPGKWNGYKYSGKELQKEMGLNWGDHGARMADYTIGRWWVPDPLAEEYPWSSPYAYCSNNPMNRIDPYGRADFLVNKQFLFWNWTKVVGNDGINDGRQLVLKTTQTSFGEGENSISGAGLSKSDLKATVNFVKQNSGNTEAFQNDGMAYTNSVEIESSAVNRQAMVNEASRDNGKGGTTDANNREYGGSIQNGNVVLAEPGAVSNPATQSNASIVLPAGVPTFHSHPSGTRSEAVEGGTRNSWFTQHPSRTDVTNSGARMEYVFGRGNGKVYIYNSSGVQAIMPMKYFVTPKR
jgi:RHS repeat-associated protein